MGKSRLMKWYGAVRDFFTDGLWNCELTGMPTFKRWGMLILKVLFLTGRSYQKDGCGLQASALTYITLVSLVPVLAIMFAFSKGIGMQKRLFDAIGVERVQVVSPAGGSKADYDFVVKLKDEETHEATPVAQLPESMQNVTIQVLKYVDNTNFAAMGVIGSVMLIISVVMSIAKLENCFNLIWGVSVSRSFLRKLSEYLIVLIVVPILFVVVTSANSLLMSEGIIRILENYFGNVAFIMVLLCKAVTALMLLLFFAFIYMFMPHTKVKLTAGLLSGFIAGALWLIVLFVYLKMQIGLSKFNQIYGTFAALPFFLALIYANWCIVLLGCEFSYAIQYHRFMRTDKMARPMPAGACMILGQLAMYEACRAFAGKQHGWNPEAYGIAHSIPLRQLQYAVFVLVRAGLLVQLATQKEEDVFVPGCMPDTITPATVEEAFRDFRGVDGKKYMQMMPETLRNTLAKLYDGYLDGLADIDFEKMVVMSENGGGVARG